MTLAQEEKATLEKKVKKMEKEETQKELETNALITQTLADLKKYQNMDQMKEEEDKELRKDDSELKKKLDASKKTISSLDHQLSESMKRSMKVIGTFSDQLMKEKEKEVAALSQVVDTKSGMVKEKDQLSKLHQDLLEQNDKAFAESLQIEGQTKEINQLKDKMKNQTTNMKLGQQKMEQDLKAAIEEAKKVGFQEGKAQEKEYYRLANEQQSLVQQKVLSTKKSEMEVMSEKEASLQKNLEASKKQLAETLAQKSTLDTQIKNAFAKEEEINKTIAKEQTQEKK